MRIVHQLAKDGSIYVHCDYRVNSYIRIVMDEIFGKDNFRNEIFASRVKKNVNEYEKAKSLNVDLDNILFYSKSDEVSLELPKKITKKEPRWHSFEASGIRGHTEYCHSNNPVRKAGKITGATC